MNAPQSSETAVSKPLPSLAKGDKADVVLLLEGTYPYVSGGVSSWVHQIIRGLSELKFALVFLGSVPEQYGAIKYELPSNVVHLERHYLMQNWRFIPPRLTRGNKKVFAEMAKLHELFRAPERGLTSGDDLLRSIASSLGSKHGIPREDFLYSEQSWLRVCEDYQKFCTDPSFVGYFWTIRTMHGPVFTLAEIAQTCPWADVYHSISTGYAGLLGALLRYQRERPFMLTEHGIYTKERKIDLAHADWIKDAAEEFGGGLDEGIGYIRHLWIRFFEGLGRLAYQAANPITGLFEGNRQRQIADGAPKERTRVIPNGIDLERFAALRPKRPKHPPHVLGLIGRVVPIKDIRTFIRAMRTICNRLPDAEGWIVGPEEEDANYAKECKDLVVSLGLEANVKFLGFRRPDDILPKLGLLMLTSISEALPLVLLEGFAAGVPAVATDVGSCRELIEGASSEDRAFGAAGAVVPIADPESTARAALGLLTDEGQWMASQQAGISRVERYYTQARMFASYRAVYGEALRGANGGNRLRDS